MSKKGMIQLMREKYAFLNEDMRRKIGRYSGLERITSAEARKRLTEKLKGRYDPNDPRRHKQFRRDQYKNLGFSDREKKRAEGIYLADKRKEREGRTAEEERLSTIKRRSLNFRRFEMEAERDNSPVAENLLNKRVKMTADRKSARTEEATRRVMEKEEGGKRRKITAADIEAGTFAERGEKSVSILANKQAGELGGMHAERGGGGPVAAQPDARRVAGSFSPESKLTGNFSGAGGNAGAGQGKALPGGGGLNRNTGSRPSIPLPR